MPEFSLQKRDMIEANAPHWAEFIEAKVPIPTLYLDISTWYLQHP